MSFQTGASDTQKWALDWTPSGSLVLYSSDIGTLAYDVNEGKIMERRPTDEEELIGRKAYEKRFGRPPH